MPETQSLIIRTISQLLAEKPWVRASLVEPMPLEVRIKGILILENITLTHLRIVASVWLFEHLGERHPTAADIVDLLSDIDEFRWPSERTEHITELQTRIEIMTTKRHTLEQSGNGGLMLNHYIRNAVDRTPDQIREVLNKFNRGTLPDQPLSPGKAITRVREILESLPHMTERVQIGVAAWLYRQVSGMWPTREPLLDIFAVGKGKISIRAKTVDDLLEFGTLRMRNINQIALSRAIDPTREP